MHRKSRLVTGIIMLVFFLCGLYLWFQRSFVEQAGPAPSPSHAPVEQNEHDKKSESVGRTGFSEKSEMEFLPDPVQLTNNNPVDLAEHSLSFKKKKRDIEIAPDVLIRPAEGVIIKSSDSDETIRIKRDSTYHSGEYKVFLERKY
jgi:hypothetical protein